MEITRQALGAGSKEEFRSRQLTARQMLTGELDGPALEEYVESRLLTTTLDKASRWRLRGPTNEFSMTKTRPRMVPSPRKTMAGR